LRDVVNRFIDIANCDTSSKDNWLEHTTAVTVEDQEVGHASSGDDSGDYSGRKSLKPSSAGIK
jgi:hypothetical protein